MGKEYSLGGGRGTPKPDPSESLSLPLCRVWRWVPDALYMTGIGVPLSLDLLPEDPECLKLGGMAEGRVRVPGIYVSGQALGTGNTLENKPHRNPCSFGASLLYG